MDRFKKIVSISLVVMMIASFGGCSTPKAPAGTLKEEKKQEIEQKVGEEQTVVVWANNRHDAEYVNKKIAEFNQINKGQIQIEYVIHTDNYANMLMMAHSSNQSPDVMNIASISSGFNLSTFAEAGIIKPLNQHITDEFAERVDLESVKFQGMNVLDDEVYYIPTGIRSGSRLIYNKELFEKAGLTDTPKNAEELIEAAKKITKAGDGVQYGYIVPGLSAPFNRMFNPLASVSGIAPYDYKSGKFDFSGYKPVLEMARQLFIDGSVLPGATGMKVDPTRVQFAEGNVGFYGNASQEVGVLTEQFPAKIEWGAAEIPSLDGTIKGALPAAPNMGWLMSTQTKIPEVAWEVIDFFSSDDFVKGYIEAGLNLPITKRMEGLIDKSKLGKLADFLLLDYESVYPTIPKVTPEGKAWEDALWEACLPDGPGIDETIAELNKKYNEALDKEVEMGKVKRLVIKDYDPLNPSQGTFEYLSK